MDDHRNDKTDVQGRDNTRKHRLQAFLHSGGVVTGIITSAATRANVHATHIHINEAHDAGTSSTVSEMGSEKGRMSYSREKERFSREKEEEMEIRVGKEKCMQRRVNRVFRKIIFVCPTSKRTCALLWTPVLHY
ncbi:hypothetical protein LR48_Vigan09g124300 [Vigna angularis]|uniref:Uncharacterized protein n=1 Tax=Phaseolus angularis TaxID=3914 RepID=A0A0L9VD43_PHAAN|nr:hypothetical protein LR48_Vigan09g124300 [Vigna angularis]